MFFKHQLHKKNYLKLILLDLKQEKKIKRKQNREQIKEEEEKLNV